MKTVLASIFGKRSHRSIWRAACRAAADPFRSTEQAFARLPATACRDSERPIFILSAGWRSGSTLVQRLICSNSANKTLVWGEPYGRSGVIQQMRSSLNSISEVWPPDGSLIDNRSISNLEDQWIANLYPPLAAIRQAHRSFLEELLVKPARQRGFTRWGLKEVRLTAADAKYLQWVFPQACFIFLYRDPFKAYGSYAALARLWYDIWPDKPILTPTDFGMHWKRIVSSFTGNRHIENTILVRYEDLISGVFRLENLDQLIGDRVNREILQKKVGGSAPIGSNQLSGLDRWLMRRATSPIARKLGYV